MSTHILCFEQKYEKYPTFLSENFYFLMVRFSVYLNRLVFVMKCFLSFILFQKLSAIPPSAFYGQEHKHLGEKYVRFCFIKVTNFIFLLSDKILAR